MSWQLAAAAAAGAAALCLGAPRAAAQDHPPITDRSYTIDLYQGAALGSARIVGMGGASVALAEGSASMVANAASPAVRAATSTDRWDWDFHVDWFNPDLGDDFDNNGTAADDVELGRTFVFSGGVVGQYGPWALGLAITFQQHKVDLPDGTQGDPTFFVNHLILARSFRGEAYTVGVGFRTATFSIGSIAAGDGARTPLFELSGTSLEAGAVWRPPGGRLRLGASAALPIAGEEPLVAGCDPMDCAGYILPERVAAPWELAVGVAWRRGGTPWNRKVADAWRDERALLLGVDVVVSGPVDDGYGVEAFLDKTLQPSGRSPSFSVRAGAEYEWKPGRLRVRGGSYWEPARFDDADGRLHLTLGAELRVWSFCFWNDRYRLRLTLTTDAARNYGNVALSLGFWH